MLSRFALNDIVLEEFKTLSFNHVLLHKKYLLLVDYQCYTL